MTKAEAGELLEILVMAFQERRIENPEMAVTAYWMALDDVPFDLGQMAARHLIRTSKWFPKPAEIRGAALDLALPLPSPDEAWAEVMVQVRTRGHNHTPEFSSQVIADAVARIGWRNICATEEPERMGQRFTGLYASLRRREVETAKPDALWDGGPIVRVLPSAAEEAS